MSNWLGFLDVIGEEVSEQWNTLTNKPGQVMICFVNRYLDGLDGVKYKISYNGKTIEAQTTTQNYCVTITPKNFDPIDIDVWSKMKNTYKKLDSVVPEVGSKKLVRKVMKTYKTVGKTETHPKSAPVVASPQKPAPAPAPGPSPTTKQGVKPTLTKDESALSQTNVERPVPDKITKEQLKKIFVQAGDDHLQKIADELNKDLAKFKLDTPVRRAHFFGQTRQETGTTAKGGAENFKTYTPKRLAEVFSYYSKRPDEAKEDGRKEKLVSGKKTKEVTPAKEEVIANKVYGEKGAGKALGNLEGDDGWKFRGRGLKQTTGRANYTDFKEQHEKFWGDKIDFVTNPDLVAEFPYSVRSAVAFWLKKKCWMEADNGVNDAAIDAITKVVNSGEIKKHLKGKYPANNDPVVNRRKFVYLAYSAFT